jgi:hypothetical protein
MWTPVSGLRLILFSKSIGAFKAKTTGGFLHIRYTDFLLNWRQYCKAYYNDKYNYIQDCEGLRPPQTIIFLSTGTDSTPSHRSSPLTQL